MADIPLRLLISEHKTGADIIKTIGAAGAASLIGIGIAATKMASDYQSATTKLQNTTGSSDAQMKQYTATVRTLSDVTGKAQTDLEAGMYQIVSANFAGADATKILTTATKDAIIAQADQTQVTTGLVVELNAFGLKADQVDKVGNQMFKTLSLGRGQMNDLAGALQTGGALVAHYGVSVTDMDATLATLSTGGMKTFGTSMTGLTQLLNVMDGKTDLITGRIHKLGISFDENKFKAMDYEQQIAYLGKSFEDHEKAMVTVLGSKQAATALGILGTQSQLLASNLQKLGDTQELAKEKTTAWGKVQNDAAFQMQKLQTNIQNIMIDLGLQLLPILSKVMDWLTPLVKKFGDWVLTSKDVHTWITNIGSFIQYTFLPRLIDTWNAVSTFVQWLQKGSGPAQALLYTLGAIAALKTAKSIGDIASNIVTMGKNAVDAGGKLLQYFSPDSKLAAGIDSVNAKVGNIGTTAGTSAAEVTGASATMEGDNAAVGVSADTAAAQEATIGTAAATDAVEVTGAGATIGGVFATIGGWVSDVAGAIAGLLGPLAALGLVASTVPDTFKSMEQQGYFNPGTQTYIHTPRGPIFGAGTPPTTTSGQPSPSGFPGGWPYGPYYPAPPPGGGKPGNARHFASGGPVTEDGLIYAHKDEYVLSANQARTGGGAGGPNITINISTMAGSRSEIQRMADLLEQELALRFRQQTPNYGSGRAF